MFACINSADFLDFQKKIWKNIVLIFYILNKYLFLKLIPVRLYLCLMLFHTLLQQSRMRHLLALTFISHVHFIFYSCCLCCMLSLRTKFYCFFFLRFVTIAWIKWTAFQTDFRPNLDNYETILGNYEIIDLGNYEINLSK